MNFRELNLKVFTVNWRYKKKMTKKIISDGWHEQKDGTSIYTESGIIIRAIKRDHNGEFVPAKVYKSISNSSATSVCDLKYSTFKRSHLYFVR